MTPSLAEYIKSSGNTAMYRKKLSAPMRMLRSHRLLVGNMLDYGCGHGFDAREMGMDHYDPNHYPELPTSKYDVITMIYVLNTLPKRYVEGVVQSAGKLLKPTGRMFLVVRDDFPKGMVGKSTSKGTHQFAIDPEGIRVGSWVSTYRSNLSRSGSWKTYTLGA